MGKIDVITYKYVINGNKHIKASINMKDILGISTVTCRHKNVIKILFSLISKHYYILIQLILSYKQFMNQMWSLF